MIDLAAIRERDRDSERCAKCGYSESGHRDDTLAQCNRRLARAARLDGTRAKTCGEPGAHHPFEHGGGYDTWNGDEDRHLLLEYIDSLERLIKRLQRCIE